MANDLKPLGELVDDSPLAARAAAAPAVWTPSFAVAVDLAIERKAEKRRFFERVMEPGLHYGVIPGTGTKPTLLKPGAEMLLANMGLQPALTDADPPILDVTGKDHGGEAYIRYRRVCKIYRQTGPKEDDRMVIAQAEGSCSSWEPKYRYRNDQRKCPRCGKPAIIAGKKEYIKPDGSGAFICFKKKDGCGASFKADDPEITGQSVGKIANPDVAEIENTILKMADKRALVAATLLATGCSDIFTQDVEDMEIDQAPTKQAENRPQTAGNPFDDEYDSVPPSRAAAPKDDGKALDPEPPSPAELVAAFGGPAGLFKAFCTTVLGPSWDGKTLKRAERAALHAALLKRAQDSGAAGSTAKHAPDGQGGGAPRAAALPLGPESWVPAIVCNVDGGPANLTAESLAQIVAAVQEKGLDEAGFAALVKPFEITDAGLDPQEVPWLLSKIAEA